jgi:hypothetical protein
LGSNLRHKSGWCGPIRLSEQYPIAMLLGNMPLPDAEFGLASGFTHDKMY